MPRPCLAQSRDRVRALWPRQDGERATQEHGLNHAEDIVYWTDGTYTAEEVLAIEALGLGLGLGLGY